MPRWKLAAVCAVAFAAGVLAMRWAYHNIPPPRAAATAQPVNPYYEVRRVLFASTKPVDRPVVMLGDSLIEQGLWSELTGCQNIVNRGIGSDTAKGVLNRIGDVIAMKPLRVYLLIGANDAVKGLGISESAAAINATMQRLRDAGIEAYRIETLPVAGRFADYSGRIRELNDAVGGTPIRVGIEAGDLSFDGIHLRASGYLKVIKHIGC